MLTGSISHVGYDSNRSLESVHRLSSFLFCNVLHIWTIRAIPTYMYMCIESTDSMIHVRCKYAVCIWMKTQNQ